MHFVSVKGENVPIKTVHLTDDSASRVKVTLWRELASSGDTRPGDYVQITDFIPSTYNSEISLSASSNSAVKKTEAPLLRVTKTVVGICIQEGTAELLCETEEVLTVSAEVLQQAFPDVNDLETITEYGPKILIFETKGSDVIRISQTHQ